jgi:hypothetical protein
MTKPTAPTYPLPRPADDPNFNFGLFTDVAKVLAEHGYPPITSGGDIVRLQQALFGFLYEEEGH